MASTSVSESPPNHIALARDAALSTWVACIAMGVADGFFCTSPEFPSTTALVSASVALHCGLACVLSPVSAGAAWAFSRTRSALEWSWRRVGIILAALGGLASVVFLTVLSSRGVILSALPPQPFVLLALFALLGLLSIVVLQRVLSPKYSPLYTWLIASIAGLLLGSSLFVASNAHLEPLSLHAVSSKPLARFIRSQADRDNDTYPASYCLRACDCDDTAADVFPGAREVANNGRDEDCFEGDLVVSQNTKGEARKVDDDPSTKPPLFASRPNVLLITVDTLRADHLGAYGYTFDISPNIDTLASESTLFLRARAQGSMTRYSIPSMMTGRYVSELARNRKAWTKIMDENLVLGEVLAASGIRPFAVHAIAYLHPRYGMAQGFETYDMTPVQQRGTNFTQATDDLVTDRALHHLDTSLLKTPNTPWFLWAYYGDPHAGYVRHKSVPFVRRGMKGMYDHEIAFTDQQIGRLLEGLKERGAYDNTLIIFTSDHGEGLDEKEDHGLLYHGDTLYDNVLHVPLFIRVPNQPARKVPTVVGNIDLFPTLVEALDLTLPPNTILHGTSLVPWLRGETPKHPPVFSEKAISYGPPLKAMIDWPWKVIWNTSFGRFQLFNIEDDPGERKNLARSHPEELERLKRAFQVWRSTTLREVKAVP